MAELEQLGTWVAVLPAVPLCAPLFVGWGASSRCRTVSLPQSSLGRGHSCGQQSPRHWGSERSQLGFQLGVYIMRDKSKTRGRVTWGSVSVCGIHRGQGKKSRKARLPVFLLVC